MLVAGIPPQPADKIERVASSTDYISIQVPLVTDDGGVIIDAYQVQMDDGLQGSFFTYYEGVERDLMVGEGFVKSGRTYRFRYRVLNAKGWSDYSEQTRILAADVPSKPRTAPFLVSVDSTQITIGISPCGDPNGSPISEYVVYSQETVDGTPTEIATLLPGDTFEV